MVSDEIHNTHLFLDLATWETHVYESPWFAVVYVHYSLLLKEYSSQKKKKIDENIPGFLSI